MNHKLVFLFLISIVLFSSCIHENTKNKISISGTNFSEEINTRQNLTFTFDKNIMPAESLNKWMGEDFILFDPAVDGNFRWTKSNELTFSPSRSFMVNSSYTIKLGKVLEQNNDYVIDEAYTASFSTPALKIKDANASWRLTTGNEENGTLGIKINFNHNIKPTTFGNEVKATINGQAYDASISSSSINSTLELKIAAPLSVKDNETFKVEITDGYEVASSENNNNKVLTTTINMPQPGELIISGHSVEHNGTQGEIFVNCNQQLKSQNLKDYINITPALDYNVEVNANGLHIFSNNFDLSESYSFTIKKGLEGILSEGLSSAYTAQFFFGDLEPSIRFLSDKSKYLSAAGSKNMAVEIVNIPEISVKINKVFSNNIKALFKKGMDRKYHREYDKENDKHSYYNYKTYNTNEFGKPVFNETIKTSTLETVGKLRLLNLNFEDILEDYNGIYIVQVSHPEKKYLTSSQIVSLSDIGIISKESKDEVHVFLNSIKTTQPISGASVSLVDQTNQKLISRPSDGEGVVVFKKSEITMIEPSIKMVEVKTTTDYNFLAFDKSQMNSARFEVGGLRNHKSNYLAYIYGERELYRPGETLNITGLVRTNDLDLPGEIPMVIKCLLPSGKEYKTINKQLNAQGAFETQIALSPTATTGNYTLELYTGNNLFISSENIKVEEFVPDRIKVTATTDKTIYENGDTIELAGNAVNFFGPPAKNRNYETDFSISKVNFNPKEYNQYYFYIADDTKFQNVIKEGKTDGEGNVLGKYVIPKVYQNIGKLRGKIFTTVFDETGRPVSKGSYMDIYTQNVFYGIKHFNTYVNTNSNLPLNFIALSKEEELLDKQQMYLQVVRHFYKTVLEKDSRGRYRYKSYRQTETVADEVLVVSGNRTQFNFTPKHSGEYEVLFGHQDSKLKYSFYAYGKDNTNYASFEVNKEGKIDFQNNEENYLVGEQANLILSTPFQGRVLVTVERDNIIKHYYTNTTKRTAELTIDITKDMVPNAYVTATLIKPVGDNDSPLTVAYGITNLQVKDESKDIPINIIADSKIRSNQKYTFTIESEPNTEMTVAVVDEGILNITNYESPSAGNFFYQKRGLEVEAYDLYPYLFPEISDGGLLIGGGSAEDLNQRSVGFGNKRFNLTSFWSGLVTTNESGIYDMELDIPEFSGDLRVMVVNYNGDKFGAAQANIKVADPVVISTGLPRFLSPGDALDIPITFSNTTRSSLDNTIDVTVEGPVEILSDTNLNRTIEPNEEEQILLKAKVKNELGDAKVTVTSKVGSETFTQTTNIAVRPASPLQKRSGAGILKANTAENISMENDLIPASVNGNLLLTNSPIAEFGDKLSYLLKYPHGCLEQITSKAFPLVYAEELAKDIGLDLNNDEVLNPHYLVQSAIYDLQTLQMSNGGFTYWRSSYSNIHWWGSVYVAHFLTEAKKAGYDVNDAILEKAYKYINEKNKSKETTAYYYNKNVKKEQVRREIPYGLFVLSLAGQPDVSLMNYYKSYPKLLSTDGKYMLGAAFGIAGDISKFRDMIPASFGGEKAIGEFDGSFSSFIRDMAISLYVLCEVEPGNPQIPAMAKKLSEEFKQRRYFNTQEAAFTILALGKLSLLNKDNNVTADIYADGDLIAQYDGSENQNISWATLAGKNIEVKTKGQGQLYYFYEVAGLSEKNEVEEVDNFLEVRKSFYDRSGNIININDIKQNDLIVVKLSLRSKDKKVPNVVLSDILPAGFEIENPRLTETADMTWQKDVGQYDHIDFRDDRVHIYTTAYPSYKNNKKAGYKNYYYMVRAVSKGKYVMGPTSADAMYNGEYYSYNGSGKVNID